MSAPRLDQQVLLNDQIDHNSHRENTHAQHALSDHGRGHDDRHARRRGDGDDGRVESEKGEQQRAPNRRFVTTQTAVPSQQTWYLSALKKQVGVCLITALA